MCASKRVAMRDYSSRLAATLLWGDTLCEGFLVVFRCCLLFAAGRLKEIRDGCHGVVGPLSFVLEEERAVMAVRAESGWLAWDYDATRGYPGEDG